MKKGQEFKSLANCHAIGLYSHPIRQTDEFVERLFIDTLGNCFSVAPHSHRYPLDLKMVSGTMTHSIWVPQEKGAIHMHHFNWESPLNGGEGRFVPTGDSARYNVQTNILTEGKVCSMKSHAIHSLVTVPGTSWIITEYLDETEDTVTLHYNDTYEPDLTGLYQVL